MFTSKDFYKQSTYNAETKEQMWCSAVQDIHDSFCGCPTPYAHFLACIFPLGHADRDKSINQILKRDYRERCLSGGDADESSGMVDTAQSAAAAGLQDAGGHTGASDTADDLLLAAVAAAEER